MVGRKLQNSKTALMQWAKVNRKPVKELIEAKTREIKNLQEEEGVFDIGKFGQFRKEVNSLMDQMRSTLDREQKLNG